MKHVGVSGHEAWCNEETPDGVVEQLEGMGLESDHVCEDRV